MFILLRIRQSYHKRSPKAFILCHEGEKTMTESLFVTQSIPWKHLQPHGCHSNSWAIYTQKSAFILWIVHEARLDVVHRHSHAACHNEYCLSIRLWLQCGFLLLLQTTLTDWQHTPPYKTSPLRVTGFSSQSHRSALPVSVLIIEACSRMKQSISSPACCSYERSTQSGTAQGFTLFTSSFL